MNNLFEIETVFAYLIFITNDYVFIIMNKLSHGELFIRRHSVFFCVACIVNIH